MNTVHHAFWTYFVFRKKKNLVKWFVLGAIWPDIIYFIMFLFIGIQKGILSPGLFFDLLKMPMFGFQSGVPNASATQLHGLVLELFKHPVVVTLRVAGHSLLVWSVAFGLIVWRSGLQISPLKAFLWGWLGHTVTDLLTHVTDATPLFWPVSDIVVRGPVSYWNPDYYGREFSIVNNILTLLAIIYLIREAWKTKKYKKKVETAQ
jgi:hypothetical protein